MKINKIKYSIFFIIVIFSFSFVTSCSPAKTIQNEPIKEKIEEKNTFEDSTEKVEEIKEETTEEALSKEEGQQQTDQTQEEEQQQTDSIEVVSLTSPISIGALSSLTIKTVPNVHCTIIICNADSICIMAKGLEPKDSDGNGNCTWSWNVESGTILGDWKIVIVAEGVGQTEANLTVIE